jgi:hypothetical protein
MRVNKYFAVDPKFAGELKLEIEKNEPVTILVYLRWAGFVGYGGLKEVLRDEAGGKSGEGCANVKPRTGRSKSPKNLDNRTFFSVEWVQTLPREQAYFRMQANQPNKPVEVFSDPVLWRIIVGRLQFRSDKLTAPRS